MNAELRRLELVTGYFSYKQIKTATKNFDIANKIGEGGFGPVYKVQIHIVKCHLTFILVG